MFLNKNNEYNSVCEQFFKIIINYHLSQYHKLKAVYDNV